MQQNTNNNITVEENNKDARHKQSRKQQLENICQQEILKRKKSDSQNKQQIKYKLIMKEKKKPWADSK